jgi:SAM-dependent methyltransferase
MFTDRLKQFSQWGAIYWSPAVYRVTMKLLEGRRGQADMYQHVTQQVKGCSVLELCCGDGEFIRWVNPTDYQGIDKNPAFVQSLRRKGIAVIEGDVLSIPWPNADCLVMINSLYHFIHDLQRLREKIRSHPGRRIIISEPVKNLLPELPPLLRRLGAWVTRVDGRSHPERFSEDALRKFFIECGLRTVTRVGAHCIGVGEKRG